jgi:hypothetical protein
MLMKKTKQSMYSQRPYSVPVLAIKYLFPVQATPMISSATCKEVLLEPPCKKQWPMTKTFSLARVSVKNPFCTCPSFPEDAKKGLKKSILGRRKNF